MTPSAVLVCDRCGVRDAERLERFGPPSCFRCGRKMRAEVAGIVVQLERAP